MKHTPMMDAYPDTRVLNGAGDRSKGDKIPSPAQRAKLAEETARFKALPRCRCGLLLPCDSCVAPNAAVHMLLNMVREESAMPETSSGLNSHDVQKGATPWLKAHDRGAGYSSHRGLK